MVQAGVHVLLADEIIIFYMVLDSCLTQYFLNVNIILIPSYQISVVIVMDKLDIVETVPGENDHSISLAVRLRAVSVKVDEESSSTVKAEFMILAVIS